MPSLQTSLGLASTHEAKVAALKEQFFLITETDLSDLQRQVDQPSFEVEQSTSQEEIAGILRSCSSSSAPGEDEIPFHFLKALGEPVARALTLLANACL